MILALVRGRPGGRGLHAVVALGSSAAVLAIYWVTPLDFDYHVATSVRRVITVTGRLRGRDGAAAAVAARSGDQSAR